jgi:hypothetical protein
MHFCINISTLDVEKFEKLLAYFGNSKPLPSTVAIEWEWVIIL